jgi:hypothetical protein
VLGRAPVIEGPALNTSAVWTNVDVRQG